MAEHEGGLPNQVSHQDSPRSLQPGAGPSSTLPTCRICWEGAGQEGEADSSPAQRGPLLSGVCRCSGSQAHVHRHCLQEWQNSAANPSTCPTCLAPLPPLLPRVAALQGPAALLRYCRTLAAEEAGRFRRAPGRALLRLWYHGVELTALASAVVQAQRGWVQAPQLALKLREQPLAARGRVLASVLLAAVYQRAWLPMGAAGAERQQRWLGLHLRFYAAGMVLDAAGQRALCMLRATPMGACTALAGAAHSAREAAAGAGLLLQLVGLQHLHPYACFVQGHARGLLRALAWGQGVLVWALRALGCGGSRGRRGLDPGGFWAILAALLPGVLHGMARGAVQAGAGGGV